MAKALMVVVGGLCSWRTGAVQLEGPGSLTPILPVQSHWAASAQAGERRATVPAT